MKDAKHQFYLLVIGGALLLLAWFAPNLRDWIRSYFASIGVRLAMAISGLALVLIAVMPGRSKRNPKVSQFR